MIRHEMSLNEALGHLVLARPTLSPNAGFPRQLKDIEKSLCGRVTLDLKSYREGNVSKDALRLTLYATENWVLVSTVNA